MSLPDPEPPLTVEEARAWFAEVKAMFPGRYGKVGHATA